MPTTTYNGYTITTQVAMPDDNTTVWRYRLHKRSPLTDYPSAFVYATAEEAEAAGKAHVDRIAGLAVAEFLTRLQADTEELNNGLQRVDKYLSQPYPTYPK